MEHPHAIIGTEDRLHGTLRVGHETKDITRTVANPGDLLDGAVQRRRCSFGIAVAQEDLAVLLQLRQSRLIDEVVAIGVRHGDTEHFTGCPLIEEGVVGVDHHEVLDLGDEGEVGVAFEGTGEESRFGEDLEAIADAEDVAPLVCVRRDGFHHG